MRKLSRIVAILLTTVMLIQLNVFAVDNFEPNDSFSTSCQLSGSNTNSYISASTDEDYYKFTGSKMIYTYVTSPAGATYDVYLYDKNYNLIGSTLTPTIGTAIAKATTQGETYYLKVVSRNGSYDENNMYSLIVYFKFPFI